MYFWKDRSEYVAILMKEDGFGQNYEIVFREHSFDGNHENQLTPMLIEAGEGGLGVVAEVAAGCRSSVLLGQSGEAVLRLGCAA